MKNTKIFAKILVLALTLATVMGVFVVGSAAVADPVEGLLDGIDFDSLTKGANRDAVADATGLYFTSGNSIVTVQENPDKTGDMRLYFNSGAAYIKGGGRNASKALAELLFTKNGPDTFKIEMDIAINNAFEGTVTGNNTASAYPVTRHRGFSVFNFGNGWAFKATAPGVGTVNIAKDGENDKKVGSDGVSKGDFYYVESVNPGTENVGYYYASNSNCYTSYYFPASAKMGWAGSGYKGSMVGAIEDGGKTYVSGTADSSVTNAGITGGTAIPYTVGVPQHFVFSFEKNKAGDYMRVTVDIDGKRFINGNDLMYSLTDKNYEAGWRFTDLAGVGMSVDNFKVTLTGDAHQINAHKSVYGWANIEKTITDVGAKKGFILKEVCEDCGDVIREVYPNVLTVLPDMLDRTTYEIHSVRELWSTYKNSAFNLSFDWTVDALPTDANDLSLLTWLTKEPSEGAGEQYGILMRLYKDGSLKMGVENGGYGSTFVECATPLKVKAGETYKVDIRFDFEHSTWSLFVDGVYCGTQYRVALSSKSQADGYPRLRFCVDKIGKQDFTNVVITESVTPEKHNHTNSLSDASDSSVIVGEKSIATAYTCYCGEAVSNGDGISKLLADNLVDSYEGTATVEGLPTEGSYWIAFNYNVRTADAVSGAGVSIAKLGNTPILDASAAFDKPTTVTYAIKVTHTDDGVDCEVYADGVFSHSYEGLTVDGDASVLTLGQSNVDDVRFNYVKVAEVSAVETPLVPTFTANDLRPCYHDGCAETEVAIVIDGDKIYKTYKCKGCGESFEEALVDRFDPNSQTAIKNRNFDIGMLGLIVPDDVKLTSVTKPYYISFDLKIESFDINKMLTEQSNTPTAGRNIFGFAGPGYGNILRMFLVPNEDATTDDKNSPDYYRDDYVVVRNNNNQNADIVLDKMYKDKTYSFVLQVTPETGRFDIYVDGEYKATKTQKISDSSQNFRFYEGASWGPGKVTNFSIAQDQNVYDKTHTHTDKWLNAAELAESKLALADGNKVEYSYKCYCGETVTGGISEVTYDAIAPVYGNEGAVVAVESVTAPDAGFAILAKINAQKLPASEASLVAIGEQTLVSIGADGKLSVDGAVVDSAVFTEGRDYHEVAVYFDVEASEYAVYFDGKYIASADYTELDGALKFFAENGGRYILERAVFATLAEGKDNTYTVGESDHVHAYTDVVADGVALTGHGQDAKITYVCPSCYANVTETVAATAHPAAKLDDAYEFHAMLDIPEEELDSFWAFVEVNNRDPEAFAINGNIIKVGDAVLAAFENGAIVGYNGVKSEVTLDGVGFHKVAARIAAEGYMLYVDGKLVTVADVPELADGFADYFEFGGEGCEKVRFVNPALVTFADGGNYVIDWNKNELRPCYHKNYAALDSKMIYDKNTNTLRIEGTCSQCGEKVITPLNNLFDPTLGGNATNEAIGNGETLTVKGYVGMKTTESVIGPAADPLTIEFDVSVEAINEDILPNIGSNNQDMGRTFFGGSDSTNTYTHMLRLFTVPNEETAEENDYYKDRAYIRINNTVNGPIVIVIEEGHGYHFKVNYNPSSGAINVYAYDLDTPGDVKTASGSIGRQKAGQDNYALRFLDNFSGTYYVSNFYLYNDKVEASEEAHVHTDKWVYISEKGVDFTHKTLEPYYYCYCGTKVSYGNINEIVKDDIPTVYSGVGTVELSDKTDVWFSTDVNLRASELANGNLIKVGDTVVLAIKDGYIVYGNGSAPIENLPTTYNISFKFVAEDKIDIYINGKPWAINYAVDAEANKIMLGDEAFGKSVRFNYNKLVKIGDGETLVPKFVLENVKPCYHDNYFAGNELLIKNAGNEYYKTYICTGCGERAYMPLTDKFDASKQHWIDIQDRNANLKAESIVLDAETLLNTELPYYISFDIRVDSFDIEAMLNKSNTPTAGRSLFGFNDANTYPNVLRMFLIPDETSPTGYRHDSVNVATELGKPEPRVMTLHTGVTYNFAFKIDQGAKTVDYYVDGEYVTSKKLDLSTSKIKDHAKVRIFEQTWGTGEISNFAYAQELKCAHSDSWLDVSEIEASAIIRTEDNKLAYSFKCYCGETATFGISEVIKDSVAPAYGITEEKEIIADFVAPDKDFVIVGDMRNMTNDGKAHISIGDKALVTVNANGKPNGVNVEIPVDGKYHAVALRFDVSEKMYTLYIDGKYAFCASYTELSGALKIASEGAGKYHFDSAAVVVLGNGGDLAYQIAEGAHIHWYNVGDAKLEIGEDRTTITAKYICAECDRSVFDGISANLCDDPATETVETILPVFGTADVIIAESAILTGEKPYWISFDATLKSDSITAVDTLIKLVDADGNETALLTLSRIGRVADANGNAVATLGAELTNITINVVNGADSAVYYLYVDGIYCGEYALELDQAKLYSVVLGTAQAAGLELTDIKFAEMANGEGIAIGTFVCENADHVSTINKNSYVEYLNANEFKFVSRCARCGAVITEEIVESFYTATPHVYEAYGDMNVVKTECTADKYWVIADINVRGGVGLFNGFVPLISDNGIAIVLINSNGELMLADGTKVGVALLAPSTHNVAVKCEGGVYHLFLDGAYKCSTTGANFKEGYKSENSNQYFGSPELKNIRYYNVKAVVTAVTDAPMSVQFVEDLSVLPCVHEYHNFQNVTILLDDVIKEIYTCNKCGEKITRVNSKDILSEADNPGIKNGAFTVTNTFQIYSSESVLSKAGDPYWIKFTIEFTDIASAETLNGQNGGAGRKGGVTLFSLTSNGSYPMLLRMFSVEDGKGGYIDDVVEIRDAASRQANLIAVVHEGETHDVVIGVNPQNGLFRVYFDGKLATQRTTNTLNTGRSGYNFRFLDGKWGTYNISNFEFVTAPKHEHTAKYAPYMDGGYDVLAFTDGTLTHRYTCYCGANVVEGIDRIYEDPIEKIDGATDYTAIKGGKAIKMGADPYWFSTKVYIKSYSANVYSYGRDTQLVEINAEGKYVVGGVVTELSASAIGDYDIVSVKVYPVSGEYDVYVNGAYLASGKAGFTQKENFNILLGGAGSNIAFSHIKLVGLKDGASGQVINCGDHSFNNELMTVKYESDESGKVTTLVYTCAFCGKEIIRTVTPNANDLIYGTGLKTSGNVVSLRSEPIKNEETGDITYETDKFAALVDKNYEGSRWLTFEATPEDIIIGAGVNNAFVCWVYDYKSGSEAAFTRFLRAFGVDDAKNKVEVRLYKGGAHVAAIGNPVIEEGKTYKFAIEYFTSTGVYYAYMSDAGSDVLKYIGDGNLGNMDYSEKGNPNKDDRPKNEEYGIRFGDTKVGTININNVNVFNSQAVVDRPVEDNSVQLQSHFPKNSAPGTLTYENGVLKHSFTCADGSCKCGKTFTYQTFYNAQNTELNGGKLVTELLDVKSATSFKVDESLVIKKGAVPYYLAFDLTPDKINVNDIKNKTESDPTNGASIVALVGFTSSSKASYLNFLRAFYRDGRVVLDSPLDTGNEFELEIKEGETYSFAFMVNPENGYIVCSVNGKTIRYNAVHKLNAGYKSYYFRFVDNTWGQYDFTNIKFGYLTDECVHDGKTCADVEDKTYTCELCNHTVFTAHNYAVATDATGKWTVYVCTTEGCNEYFMIFNDPSLVADMTFATDDLLMDYLVKTYPPVVVLGLIEE